LILEESSLFLRIYTLQQVCINRLKSKRKQSRMESFNSAIILHLNKPDKLSSESGCFIS